MSNGGALIDSMVTLLQQFEPPAVLMIVDQQGHIQDFRVTTLGELIARQRSTEEALAKREEFSTLRVENSSAEEQA